MVGLANLPMHCKPILPTLSGNKEVPSSVSISDNFPTSLLVHSVPHFACRVSATVQTEDCSPSAVTASCEVLLSVSRNKHERGNQWHQRRQWTWLVRHL